MYHFVWLQNVVIISVLRVPACCYHWRFDGVARLSCVSVRFIDFLPREEGFLRTHRAGALRCSNYCRFKAERAPQTKERGR